jgi:hypothetical protein
VDRPKIFDGNCNNDPDATNHVVLIYGYGEIDGVPYWKILNK